MVFTTRPIKSYNTFYSVERLLELKFFDITPALILIVTYKYISIYNNRNNICLNWFILGRARKGYRKDLQDVTSRGKLLF